MCGHSDSETSRHYFPGVPPKAFLPGQLAPQPRCSGVAADFGTMNDQSSDITIGERTGWGEPQPFGIAAVDERQHIYIIGETGAGTSHAIAEAVAKLFEECDFAF